MDLVATLRPLAGSPVAVERLVADWLEDSEPPPLSVRTSGSSGAPKDVVLSVSAVLASARATLSRLGGPGQWVLALPAHYVAGLQVVVRSLLAGASPVVLADHIDLAAAAGAMTGSRRYLALVPTQLHRLLAAPSEAAALASFDAVLLGGSAAPAGLLERARGLGVNLVTTYGMSETCGGCVYDGVPLDGVAVSVADDGRVLISGPVLFDGYVDQPALSAEVLRGGWLHTPDLGRFDEAGRLEILGRIDDVAVSGGVNVPLAAVERRLLEHPSISQASALGVPDDEWGARVVAVVVLAADVEPPTLTELRDFVGALHPREWSPRQLVATTALPMLESGKVDKQALQTSLAGAHA